MLSTTDSFTKLSSGYSTNCKKCQLEVGEDKKFCPQCRRDRPRTAYHRWHKGLRRDCRDCTRTLPTHRPCTSCGIVQAYDQFPRMKRNIMSDNCHACHARKARESSNRPQWVSHPCDNCEQPFKLALPPYTRNRVRYCGETCRTEAREKQLRECILCLRHKPMAEFPHRGGKKGRKLHCRDCSEKKAEGLFRKTTAKISVQAMLHYVRMRARDNDTRMRVAAVNVAPLTHLPCELCGDEMHTLVVKNATLDITVDNLAPSCRPCRDMVAKRGYHAMVNWALCVAEGLGWCKPGLRPTKRAKVQRQKVQEEVPSAYC